MSRLDRGGGGANGGGGRGRPVTLVDGARPPWLAHARALFREYGDGLGVDLSFQRFEEELASLPGPYGASRGVLLLAQAGGEALGCVALRELDAETAELKRLFVRPQGRSRGVGRLLTEAALAAARDLGYCSVVLDTLPSMAAAQRLYERLGFTETAPYTHNPVAGTRFMRLDLGAELRR